MPLRALTIFVVLFLGIVAITDQVQSQTLYVLQGSEIVTTDTFFTPPTTVVSGISFGPMVAVDPVAGYIFWMDVLATKRANLDGSAPITLFSGPGTNPMMLGVNPLNQRVYWADTGLFQIRSVGYTGASPAADAGGLQLMTSGPALDPANNKLYYCLGGPGVIISNQFGLGNEQLVVGGLSNPRAVAIEPLTQTLFWVNGAGLLQSAPVATGAISTLPSVAANGSDVRRIVVDSNAAKVYVATSTAITRYELDGTLSDVVYSAPGIVDFAFVPDTGPGPEPEFDRGDCNNDGSFNIADMIFLLGSLFTAGDPGTCDDACDTNDDGARNIADAITGLNALFGGGGVGLPAPFGTCGMDATATDPFNCFENAGCP